MRNLNAILAYLILIAGTSFMFFSSGPAKAQSAPISTTVPIIKPVSISTEAAPFVKYGDVPVGLYNGIPEINIPIYNIVMKGIQVPISLSYHAGGIKMDELASNVGLGWSLNVGGAITTTVYGKPDYHGWLTQVQQIPQTPNSLQTGGWSFTDYGSDPDYHFLLSAARGVIDTQPDLFYVNMNGRSFKYYYDQSHNVFTVPYQRVKFVNDWTIIDENDTKFTFGVDEMNSTTYNYSGDDDHASDPSNSYYTNYLSEITTADKDSLSYEYENYSYSFKNQTSETRFLPFGTQYGCTTPPATTTESETNIYGQRIKKIKGNNGVEINFTYGLSRQDLPNTHALTNIVVKNSLTGAILCSYTLNYGYYNSGGSTADDYRLKLLSIQKTGENAYAFNYKWDSYEFPARLSKSQDHWGFNNNYGGSTLLPIDNTYGFYTGTSREPAEDAATVGVLNKITYPTGGYTLFDYESNQYIEAGVTKILGGIRIKSITDQPVIGTAKTRHYKYLAIGSNLPKPVYTYSFTNRQPIGGQDYGQDCQFIAQSSGSVVALGVKGGPVSYTDVEVYTESETKGYTHHKFSHFGGTSPNFSYPFAQVVPYDWVDGLPLVTTDYLWDSEASVYRPVKKVINEYKTDYGPQNNNLSNPHEFQHWGIKVAVQTYPIGAEDGPDKRGPEFFLLHIPVYSSWSYPTKTTEITYDPADSTKKVITETKLYYDNPAHINVTRQEISKSENEKYKIQFRYPQDYNPSYPYNASPVVEKRIMINQGGADRLVDAELTTHLNQAGAFPENYYNLNSTGAIVPSAIPLYGGGAIDNNYEKRRSYLYDNHNNLVSFVSDNIMRVSQKWGYKNQYVIAEVKNANTNEYFYEGFEDNSTSSTLNPHTGLKSNQGAFYVNFTLANAREYVMSYWYFDGTWKFSGEIPYTGPNTISAGTYIDDVRVHPKDAQMSTYTYQPLIGVTSKIDVKSTTSYYEYDSSQRLKCIKDQNGHIIKSYDYHYKQ